MILSISFKISSPSSLPDVHGAKRPGRPGRTFIWIPSLSAASRSIPPGMEASSRIQTSCGTPSSNPSVHTADGAVLKRNAAFSVLLKDPYIHRSSLLLLLHVRMRSHHGHTPRSYIPSFQALMNCTSASAIPCQNTQTPPKRNRTVLYRFGNRTFCCGSCIFSYNPFQLHQVIALTAAA